MSNLYGKFGVSARQEGQIRNVIKQSIGYACPNADKLNSLAEKEILIKYVEQNSVEHIIIKTGLKLRRDNTTELYLDFKKNSNDNLFILSTPRFFKSLEEADRFAIKLGKQGLSAEEQAEENTTQTNNTEEQLDLGTLQKDNLRTAIITEATADVNNQTSDITAVSSNELESLNSLDDLDILETTAENKYNSEFISHVRNVMKTCNLSKVLPTESTFYAVLKGNKININLTSFIKMISRLIFVEWCDWLINQVQSDLKDISGTILIDTNLIKADGQPLYILVTVDKNYPIRINLDCSLTDIYNAGLTKHDAVNQLLKHKQELATVKLTLDNIDIGASWKHHVLVDRQKYFEALGITDYNNALKLVVDIIEHACLLESRGINVKRFVRGGSNQISIAIPLRPLGVSKVSAAIILKMMYGRVWQIATIEGGEELKMNLQSYNYYDMPYWFSCTD